MLRILNPIYDLAFKYLMENNDIAKEIIQLIIDREIESLQIKNVETSLTTPKGSTYLRYDFKAIVREHDGTVRKVLIELQKYKATGYVPRFRAYYGENLISPDTYVDAEGDTITADLPIINIYIVGFNIPQIPVRIFHRTFRDMDGATKKEIPLCSCELIDSVTSEAYILQVGEKPKYKWQGTRIEAFIRMFRQKAKGDIKNMYIEVDESEISDPLLQTIAQRLHEGIMDDVMRRKLLAEEEYEEVMKNNTLLENGFNKLQEEHTEALKREEEAKKREEEERRQKEEAKKRESEAKKRLAIKMKRYGESIEEIINETGLSKEEIEQL